MAASAGWRHRRGTDERSRWRAVEREGQEWQGEVGVVEVGLIGDL